MAGPRERDKREERHKESSKCKENLFAAQTQELSDQAMHTDGQEAVTSKKRMLEELIAGEEIHEKRHKTEE